MMAYCEYYRSYMEDKGMHNVDIMFTNRRDAEEVLDILRDIFSKYACVTVADVYDHISEPSSYIQSRYGWTDLSDITIRPMYHMGNRYYAIHFGTDPHFLGDSIYTKKYTESKHEPEISVDILVTIDGKKYKLVPVDDE